ncbi:MAG: hypothetical protein J7M21_04735 [Planctomycetes bacterium]|nr:hypothetical protein [Planctomycetota bacterium]
MSGRNFFLLSALPPLGELGTAPPMSRADYLAHVAEAPAVRAASEALLLGEDLRQREALLAGEIEPDQADCAVLTAEQVRGEAPLPAFLVVEAPGGEQPGGGSLGVDRLWGAYYRHLAALGRANAFLAGWTAHEVALRNALAAARAKALGLDAEGYLVEPQLGGETADLAGVIAEWSAAPSPLAGLRVLDAARWEWIGDHEKWFSFADDELVAYAARLMLLGRWQRITQAQESDSTAAAGKT